MIGFPAAWQRFWRILCLGRRTPRVVGWLNQIALPPDSKGKNGQDS